MKKTIIVALLFIALASAATAQFHVTVIQAGTYLGEYRIESLGKTYKVQPHDVWGHDPLKFDTVGQRVYVVFEDGSTSHLGVMVYATNRNGMNKFYSYLITEIR